MTSAETQSLLIQGDKWEILQHMQWRNGSYSFTTGQISPDDKFNLEVVWWFRNELAAVIGAIRIIDDGKNTRIVFVPKPFPTKEGPEKFAEFYQRIKDYFEGTIIDEDEVPSAKGNSENSQESKSNQININGNVIGSTIIIGNENEVQNQKKKK